MAHDSVIRGGSIVDGTGREPYRGDLGIDGGLITAVGTVAGRGRQEIDARGMMVSPGFVDIHTHLDAQIGWDPDCTPVSWHGVTTALMGNCGVTFAPCRPQDKATLAAMMETVEDIPREAILNGLSWDWEDYGGYLDAIEKLRPGINIAGLVGHSALRYYVMGERAVEEQATPDERRQMAAIVGRSIDAGAVGFSTNRFAPHKLPDGRSIPGTFADPIELVEIARAVAPRAWPPSMTRRHALHWSRRRKAPASHRSSGTASRKPSTWAATQHPTMRPATKRTCSRWPQPPASTGRRRSCGCRAKRAAGRCSLCAFSTST